MIVSGDTTMHFGTDPMELIQWSSEVTKFHHNFEEFGWDLELQLKILLSPHHHQLFPVLISEVHSKTSKFSQDR